MKISELLKTHKPSFSFEFFPPKTDEDGEALIKTAESLRVLDPTFISVTWGAGGSTRRKTLDIVAIIKNQLKVESMAHLTCVGASREDLDAVLSEIQQKGIENVLALRGDPPKGDSTFVPHPGGFQYANELVAHIRQKWDFCLGVAGYPEGHVENPDKQKDLDNLKRKVDAGADFIVTQLFFGNGDFLRFRDRAAGRGITQPLLAGIMPITNVNQIKRFTSMCGSKIPETLLKRLESVQEDKEKVIQVGIDHATEQCRELIQEGVAGIHFYTLNRSRSTQEILKNLKSH